MQVFIAAFLGGLLFLTESLVGRVLVTLGMAAVTYTGVNLAIDQFKDFALLQFAALPPNVVGLLSILRVGESISIVFSAIATRSIFDGVANGTLKKWILK
ncbi:MAG: DUF2523 domain-containing protein [Nitrosomonas sp.]|nr:DUF2523 domain-containing protein [Nitrosomonas sp.]